MKDFAGSSITYYGLAREKLMNKYPRLIGVLVVLALICTTGLAIYLISDLVSFASNPDYKGATIGLDLKGPEKSIIPTPNDKENNGNIGTNSSGNTSSQTKMNASLLSSQAANGAVATGKSSSSSSQSSVNKKSSNSPVIRHHSSSSSSSSKSSSASSAKKSNEINNSQEQESALLNATSSLNLSQTDVTNSTITSSNLSQISEVAPTAVPASLPSSIGSLAIPAKNNPAREPASIIKFKTEASVSDNTNKAQSKKVTTKNLKLKTSTSSKKSKITASSQAAKVKQARDKMKANKDRIEQNMKKKAAQLRSKQ
jgi:hypothetical protein